MYRENAEVSADSLERRPYTADGRRRGRCDCDCDALRGTNHSRMEEAWDGMKFEWKSHGMISSRESREFTRLHESDEQNNRIRGEVDCEGKESSGY